MIFNLSRQFELHNEVECLHKSIWNCMVAVSDLFRKHCTHGMHCCINWSHNSAVCSLILKYVFGIAKCVHLLPTVFRALITVLPCDDSTSRGPCQTTLPNTCLVSLEDPAMYRIVKLSRLFAYSAYFEIAKTTVHHVVKSDHTIVAFALTTLSYPFLHTMCISKN